VVIGRELGSDGMRIERDPNLALGDVFALALYCGGRSNPIDLRGRIEADEDDGWRVAFLDLTAETRAALEGLREGLPTDPHLHTGFVIAEILAG
jgi:hypothetical protein